MRKNYVYYCSVVRHFFGHYNTACPEPEHAMGTSVLSDGSFLTVLLQDQCFKPIHNALEIDLGNVLQLSSFFIYNGCLFSIAVILN